MLERCKSRNMFTYYTAAEGGKIGENCNVFIFGRENVVCREWYKFGRWLIWLSGEIYPIHYCIVLEVMQWFPLTVQCLMSRFHILVDIIADKFEAVPLWQWCSVFCLFLHESTLVSQCQHRCRHWKEIGWSILDRSNWRKEEGGAHWRLDVCYWLRRVSTWRC